MTEEEKKAIDNLIEYVKEDEIYNGTRENLSDFDKFCINHCIDIVIVLDLIKKQQSELEKKDKIIDLMAENISSNILTTCPLADYNVDLECENKCNDNYKECWKKYFERKVKEC